MAPRERSAATISASRCGQGFTPGNAWSRDQKVSGIAVHTGARIAAAAQPQEVLTSGTVRDLVAGSGIRFDDRGSHVLKGVPGDWRLFAVTST
jgi:class 3 adenylate cyclase